MTGTTRTILGFQVYKSPVTGYWLCDRGPDGLPLTADTLAGMKELIRQYQKHPR